MSLARSSPSYGTQPYPTALLDIYRSIRLRWGVSFCGYKRGGLQNEVPTWPDLPGGPCTEIRRGGYSSHPVEEKQKDAEKSVPFCSIVSCSARDPGTLRNSGAKKWDRPLGSVPRTKYSTYVRDCPGAEFGSNFLRKAPSEGDGIGRGARRAPALLTAWPSLSPADVQPFSDCAAYCGSQARLA